MNDLKQPDDNDSATQHTGIALDNGALNFEMAIEDIDWLIEDSGIVSGYLQFVSLEVTYSRQLTDSQFSLNQIYNSLTKQDDLKPLIRSRLYTDEDDEVCFVSVLADLGIGGADVLSIGQAKPLFRKAFVILMNMQALTQDQAAPFFEYIDNLGEQAAKEVVRSVSIAPSCAGSRERLLNLVRQKTSGSMSTSNFNL